MNIQSPTLGKTTGKGTSAWIRGVSSVAIAFLVATTSLAQNQNPAVHQDAEYVDYDEAFVGDLEFDSEFDAFEENYDDNVSQVGFFKEEHSCDSSCDSCEDAPTVCRSVPWWAHRTGAFGQFLLLRPGNLDQIYAIEQNSVLPGDDPTGPVGRLNIDEQAGYRVGFNLATTNCSSLVASFTQYSGSSNNQITAAQGNVLDSQIIHPSEDTVGAASLQSSAGMKLDFQLVDLAYRHKWRASNSYVINWLAGFRYGNIGQGFTSQQDVSTATGLVDVNTRIDFDGFGMLFGVDGERRSAHSGLSIYGRGLSSFLAGNWRGNYRQTNQFGGGVIGNEYEDYRVTPVIELELGFGWQSPCGRWRANVGYLTSAWYDSVSTRQYIDAVRNTDYVSLDETITFSGLTAGVEARF